MVSLVSQVKASAQVATGDQEGAFRTLGRYVTKTPIISHVAAGVLKVCGDDELPKQFWNGANNSENALPVVEHVKGLGHYVAGDIEGGNHAMKHATDTSLNTMNSVPVVGHVKGGLHYAVGDKEGGNRAMLAATRTTAVMGAGGFLIGGPVGAVALGIGAGAEWDLRTAIVNYCETMNGICGIIDKPTKVESYFNPGLCLAGNAMTGYSGGKMAERMVRNIEIRAADNLRTIRRDRGFPEDRSIAPAKSKEVYCEATDLTTGKTYTGFNKSVRTSYQDPGLETNKFLKQNAEIQAPLARPASTCAQCHALHKLLTDPKSPTASANRARLTTLEIKLNSKIYNIPRCNNCMAYEGVVGKCTTDKTAQRVPRANEYATPGGAARGTSVGLVIKARRASN